MAYGDFKIRQSKKSRDREQAKEKRAKMAKIRAETLSKRTPEQLAKAEAVVSKSASAAPVGSGVRSNLERQLKELQTAQGKVTSNKISLSDRPKKTVIGPDGQTAQITAGIGFDKSVGGIEGIAKAAEKAKGTGTSVGLSSSGQMTQKPSTVTPSTGTPSTGMDMFKALQEAQTKAKIAGLEKARGESLSALEAEQEALTPRFQEARRQTITQAERGKAGFDQFLKQRRLEGSGAGAQAELAQNVAQQQALGGLRQQESEAVADIARRRTGVESAFASDVAATEAGGQAQLLQDLINRQAVEEERALKTQEAATAQERADFINTMSRFSGDYTAQINQVSGDNDPSNDWQIPFLEAARTAKVQGLSDAEAKAQADALNLAFDKWRSGIPLTQTEMNLIGSPTATKPKTSGVSGPTISQQLTTAKWKLENGLPLTEAESQLLGIAPGTTLTPLTDNIDAVQSGINSALGRIPRVDEAGYDIPVSENLQRSTAASQIVQAFQGGQIDENGVAELMTRNGLTETDIERAVNASQLTSGQMALPGLR